MGHLDKFIPNVKLAKEYNIAKMIASPYDYKLSDRLIIAATPREVCNKYSIFDKNNMSEIKLCSTLVLTIKEYMNPNSNLDMSDWPINSKFIFPVVGVLENELGINTLIRYNNLILNESTFFTDYEYIIDSHRVWSEDFATELYSYSHLQAIEVLFLKCTDADSIIPNLMYLTTQYKDYSLEQMENIEFAKEAISKGEAPLIDNFRSVDDEPVPNAVFDTAMIPWYATHKNVKFRPDKYTVFENDILFKEHENVGEVLYHLGIMYAVAYGCEILYQYTQITRDNIKEVIEGLFSINYTDDSFCGTYLYSYDDKDNLIINPAVEACFDKDNNTRFENYKKLFDVIIGGFEFSKSVLSNYNYFAFPVVFARMVANMHAYAYQVCRIKHAVLLYTEAKSKGLINPEDFKRDVSAKGSSELMTSGTDMTAPDNELFNLDTAIDTPEELSDKEFEEKEKRVSKDTPSDAPTLSAADMLKKDLHDSRYTFDITYVKHDISNQDAYNVIANNISLITRSLIRQIKEIKTYNTGGKQGGQISGKLDKKNLFKYQTDAKIFYNNTYKVKEMDLAFGCILDESGSMWGEKIKNGRIVMIMLHEVLSSLGINHSIIGHTSYGTYQSKIFKYYQFKEEAHHTLSKPYGLVKADDRSGNCDSGALYYMASTMKAVRNKDKIVIIFSDGQPTECTGTDLTEQVKAMEKSGIHVIGVGINFDSIKDYYPDNANGRNLKEMVNIVVSILNRYVLEKKE